MATPYPDHGEAKVDVDGILARFPYGAPADAGELRAMLLEAWYFGYTNGMADAAKFEQKLTKTWNPMKMDFE